MEAITEARELVEQCKPFVDLVNNAYWHDEEACAKLKESELQIVDLIAKCKFLIDLEYEDNVLFAVPELLVCLSILEDRHVRFVPFVKLDSFDIENSILTETKLSMCGPKTLATLCAVEDNTPIRLYTGNVVIKRNNKWFRIEPKDIFKSSIHRTIDELLVMNDVANGQNVRIAEVRAQEAGRKLQAILNGEE